MNTKKEEFQYRVCFCDTLMGEWKFVLNTTEEKSRDDIANLVDYYTEVNARNVECYSPVDIMDDLVDDHDGWYWTDDIPDVVVPQGVWKR